MRDPDDPLFAACRELDAALESAGIPHGNPLTQLIWSTFLRSKRTFEAIGYLLWQEFDTQAGMLCRPLFEDMLVAHWLDYNRNDSDWLIQRFFRHRDAMALDQLEMTERDGWPMGPYLVPDVKALRRRQNELGREFKGRARRDWWDPGEQGRGKGAPIGIEGVAAILEDAAARHERFHPRFAGGEEPLLRRYEAIIVKWFSRQLHHTAIGLPFQPHATGPVELAHDPLAAWRVLLSSYWIFGQQGYLVLGHVGQDATAYNVVFMKGFYKIGAVVVPDLTEKHPPRAAS
jgi:hypothetical protein